MGCAPSARFFVAQFNFFCCLFKNGLHVFNHLLLSILTSFEPNINLSFLFGMELVLFLVSVCQKAGCSTSTCSMA